MGTSEREKHIKLLENLLSHYKAREKCEGYYDSTLKDNVEALQYAISSLKTDLKYDLMYEEEDIYTKADMVATLEELQLEIEGLPTNRMAITDSSGLICYGYSESEPTAKDASKIIQQKINALEGETK